MFINIKELRGNRESLEVHESVDLSDIANENVQVLAIQPVDVHLTVTKKGDLFRIQGNLETQVTYPCSRCVEPFSEELKTEFDELFADDVSAVDEEEEVHKLSGDIVELDSLIEQSIYLALDFHPLCSDDCKGLCSTCGSNRNLTPCTCDTQKIDPRLAALQDLISKEDSE